VQSLFMPSRISDNIMRIKEVAEGDLGEA